MGLGFAHVAQGKVSMAGIRGKATQLFECLCRLLNNPSQKKQENVLSCKNQSLCYKQNIWEECMIISESVLCSKFVQELGADEKEEMKKR